MRDPYVVLGIDQSASQKDVKAAFRKLAKRYHPDQNPDDPGAKERFAEASAAYEIIGDKKRREQFDRGEIGGDGKEKFADFTAWSGQQGTRDGSFVNAFSGMRRQYGDGQGFRVDMGGAEDVLKDLFGATFGSGQRRQNANFGTSTYSPDQSVKAGNIKLKTNVSIKDLTRGKTSVLFPNGRKISISIPPEAGNGQVIRLKGQGEKQPGAMPGDALVTLVIEQNGKFELNGTDIRIEVRLPLKTAVKGGRITIDAPGGEISLKTPAWTTSGRVFRLKGKGLPRKDGGIGDLLVRVIISLPEKPDEQLENLFNE